MLKFEKSILDQKLSPVKYCRPKGQRFRPNLELVPVVSKICGKCGSRAKLAKYLSEVVNKGAGKRG